jgi:hypothetical protein
VRYTVQAQKEIAGSGGQSDEGREKGQSVFLEVLPTCLEHGNLCSYESQEYPPVGE